MQLEAVIKHVLGMRSDSNSINKSGFANRHKRHRCLGVITHQPGCRVLLEQSSLWVIQWGFAAQRLGRSGCTWFGSRFLVKMYLMNVSCTSSCFTRNCQSRFTGNAEGWPVLKGAKHLQLLTWTLNKSAVTLFGYRERIYAYILFGPLVLMLALSK